MANSLRAKLKKLNYEGKITDEELNELLDKLNGHDQNIYNSFGEKLVVNLIRSNICEAMESLRILKTNAEGEKKIELQGVCEGYENVIRWLDRITPTHEEADKC